MATRTYISVILPLKLEWEPCYALPEGAATPDWEGMADTDREGVTVTDREKIATPDREGVTVTVGDRVKVLFAGKTYCGVVTAVGIEPQTDLSKIKEIITVETWLERIREEEIALWRRVAEYYMCSVGEVYKAAYPQRKINLEEARAAALHKAQERHERMLEAMRTKVAKLKTKLEEKEKALESARSGTKKRAQLEGMVERLTNEVRMAVAALAHADRSSGNPTDIPTGTTTDITNGAPTGATTGTPTGATTGVPTGTTTGATNGAGNGATNGIPTGVPTGTTTGTPTDITNGTPTGVPTGIPTGTTTGAANDNPADGGSQSELSITLTQAQEVAYRKTKESLQAKKPVMLHGVTGSGKTEIYIRLADDALRSGKNVLYLVPEIALSKQLTDRVGEHFGERLLTYHSGETEARKRAVAEIIRTQSTAGATSQHTAGATSQHTAGASSQHTAEATSQHTEGATSHHTERATSSHHTGYIVLGTRSSLFLPHNNLGLIIVDEEHDSSYKQDSPAPRYNGRDTALMLSVIHNCGIVLGSATPSLEEMYNCECGRHTLVTLNERYHGDSDTQIEIIDTKAERKKRGMEGSFSRKLIEHIRKTISEGGQVMILRSRRAWASAIQCEECGEIQKCPHCNVSLSLHKTADSGFLACHYCGHKEPYRTTCSKCNGAVKALGSGTQKIEEEAATLFPEARIARLDSDTAQNRSYETKIIKEFAEGSIDILIGTQMLTKGFDFSNLRLTAVIAADTMLGIQDFRADEKAMQLLEQFKGRCGRRGSKGMFVIQTSQPEHPIYQRIAEGAAQTFSDSLLAERKAFGFPPYSRIIEITIRDRSQGRAELMASRLAAALRQTFKAPSAQGMLAASPVTGPYSPVVDKVQEEHIRCIRVSMRKDRTLAANKAALNETVSKFEKDQKYSGHITLNVDPA